MKLKVPATQLIVIGLLLVFFIWPSLSHAQTPPTFTDDVDDSVPIDGGLSLLVAAGVGYGAKKLKARKAISK